MELVWSAQVAAALLVLRVGCPSIQWSSKPTTRSGSLASSCCSVPCLAQTDPFREGRGRRQEAGLCGPCCLDHPERVARPAKELPESLRCVACLTDPIACRRTGRESYLGLDPSLRRTQTRGSCRGRTVRGARPSAASDCPSPPVGSAVWRASFERV
eukprot:scaffold2470_cov340-Prasinococcus_capsulatus_cf.AAC.1